jgi:hypothetical protein
LAATQEGSTSERTDDPAYLAPTFKGIEFETAEDHGVCEGPLLDRLGWPSYMNSLGKGTSIHALKALVVLPSAARVGELKGNAQQQWIERGLGALRRESLVYFQCAVELLNVSKQVRKEVIKK